MRIAIIGSGISGNTAAWALSPRHDVMLYEREPYFGGHAHTVDIDLGGISTPVDTGFIVYNEKNYPNLITLFKTLNVATDVSNMSFGISLDDGALEYQSDNRFGSLFAQKRNLVSPQFWLMLRDMQRFYTLGPTLAERYDLATLTLGDLLTVLKVSDGFRRTHIIPMAACIWSASFDEIMAFPAATFVNFFINHGLFSLGERPVWRTVRGGSRRYVAALVKATTTRRRLDCAVTAVERLTSGVCVHTADSHDVYDHVIMACHGDEALKLIASPTIAEVSVLQNFRTSKNHTFLHRDKKLMPKRRGVWSSWNYVASPGHAPSQSVPITYWMNRLQNIDPHHDVFVSLNPARDIDAKYIEREFSYAHPVFDMAAIKAQQHLADIQGRDRLWFAGAYWRYGFHEDGCLSGLAVADALKTLSAQTHPAEVFA